VLTSFDPDDRDFNFIEPCKCLKKARRIERVASKQWSRQASTNPQNLLQGFVFLPSVSLTAEAFGVKFSASEIGNLKNVGEFADLIEKKAG